MMVIIIIISPPLLLLYYYYYYYFFFLDNNYCCWYWYYHHCHHHHQHHHNYYYLIMTLKGRVLNILQSALCAMKCLTVPNMQALIWWPCFVELHATWLDLMVGMDGSAVTWNRLKSHFYFMYVLKKIDQRLRWGNQSTWRKPLTAC